MEKAVAWGMHTPHFQYVAPPWRHRLTRAVGILPTCLKTPSLAGASPSSLTRSPALLACWTGYKRKDGYTRLYSHEAQTYANELWRGVSVALVELAASAVLLLSAAPLSGADDSAAGASCLLAGPSLSGQRHSASQRQTHQSMLNRVTRGLLASTSRFTLSSCTCSGGFSRISSDS